MIMSAGKKPVTRVGACTMSDLAKIGMKTAAQRKTTTMATRPPVTMRHTGTRLTTATFTASTTNVTSHNQTTARRNGATTLAPGRQLAAICG